MCCLLSFELGFSHYTILSPRTITFVCLFAQISLFSKFSKYGNPYAFGQMATTQEKQNWGHQIKYCLEESQLLTWDWQKGSKKSWGISNYQEKGGENVPLLVPEKVKSLYTNPFPDIFSYRSYWTVVFATNPHTVHSKFGWYELFAHLKWFYCFHLINGLRHGGLTTISTQVGLGIRQFVDVLMVN